MPSDNFHPCISFHTPIFNTMTSKIPHVITCKAAVVREAGGAIVVEEIKVDPPKAMEVRIKTLCASICHTDILCCNGMPIPLFPRIPGHEGVGMVESIGEDVGTWLKPGDIVMPLYLGECGECLNCKSGKTNICNVHPINLNGLMRDGTSRMSMAVTGETAYHVFSCATWSEYTVIDVNYVIKAIKGAQMQGASTIIGVDINEKKATIGKAFGMTDFINPQNHPDKSVSDLVKEMTNGLGVDYSFECTGVAPLLNEALEASKIGIGTTVAIGVGMEMNWGIRNITLLSGRTLKGSLMGGIKTQSDLPVILDKCINKEIEMDKLLTHEIRLENIKEAFEILKKHECLKILINF
ncbi:alcohol dehydrogenase 1 isoform X2 [Helianthus annuus]|uniref:alcohol dehydrogenase 1 isoform X2 n=1 Tax=Helianthus annuus TaxID=4232 RepID=UPI001652E869|nr:alcohol dehydrogenase 1 isoform X2 [Helianthus annuus]